MTKHEKIVASAFTGTLMCDFSDLHAYIEDKLGRPVFTHELADEKLIEEIKLATKDDFLAIFDKDEEAPLSKPNVSALTDILFELLDEFDITDLRELSDLTLISAWCDMIGTICDGTDRDKELKAALKEWLTKVLM